MNTSAHTNTQRPIADQFSVATVAGLGATGFSVVRYLRARGLTVFVVDSRLNPPMADQLKDAYPEVKAHYGSLACDYLREAELVIASPGLSLKLPELLEAKRAGAHIIGDVELFLRENQAPVIAITGSNGKSTVTTLVGEMCKAGGYQPLVAGNIGKPVLDALTDNEAYNVAVLELSSFQLESTVMVGAQSATILNISSDHMDRYDSMGDYVLAKARVLRGAKRAVIPRHEEQLEQITRVAERLSFGLDEPITEQDYGVSRHKSGRWLVKGRTRLMLLADVPLIGMHNISNVLSALALVDFLAIPVETLIRAITDFQGLPHRMQTVSDRAGVKWVNDSKATNVGATTTALRSLEAQVYWLAGGDGKGADFDELKDVLPGPVLHAILFGQDAQSIEESISSCVKTTRVDSLQAAVELANELAMKGDIVLLSPACASFDMFKSFEDRGQQFAEIVNLLTATDDKTRIAKTDARSSGVIS